MSNLAMCVTGLPTGLRLRQLTAAHSSELTALVQEQELRFFGVTQTNDPEIRGTLHAPELHGTRGTAGLWEDGRLVAALLAFDGLEHERGLYLDMFVSPSVARRPEITHCLVRGSEDYGQSLPVPADSFVKSESFEGDTEVETVLAERGYERHRFYLRMRIDFQQDPGFSALPPGLAARPMTDALWAQVHHVVTEAFRDHYDSHPLPLELFRRDMVHETTDMSQWQLVFDGAECVAVCVGSNRFEPFALGYVDCLAVLREYRGRGIAKYLLHEAFRRDHTAGFTGTSLHCDASNPTGATQLYRGVGMQKDQQYAAWRLPLRG